MAKYSDYRKNKKVVVFVGEKVKSSQVSGKFEGLSLKGGMKWIRC